MTAAVETVKKQPTQISNVSSHIIPPVDEIDSLLDVTDSVDSMSILDDVEQYVIRCCFFEI